MNPETRGNGEPAVGQRRWGGRTRIVLAQSVVTAASGTELDQSALGATPPQAEERVTDRGVLGSTATEGAWAPVDSVDGET